MFEEGDQVLVTCDCETFHGPVSAGDEGRFLRAELTQVMVHFPKLVAPVWIHRQYVAKALPPEPLPKSRFQVIEEM